MKLWIMGGIEALRFFSDTKTKSIVKKVFTQYDSENYHSVIQRMQDLGCGAFFTVNQTNGRGAMSEDIMSVRSYYLDFDNVPDKDSALLALLDAKLQPSAIVETKSGFHAYWYASQPLPVDKVMYRRIQSGLVAAFRDHGSDESAKDLARVLRLPNTLHLKDPKNPFLIRIIHQKTARLVPYYSRDAMLEAFPAPEQRLRNEVPVRKSPDSWLMYLSDLSKWQSKPGDRNMVMLLSAGVAIKFGVPVEQFVSGMLPIVSTWGIGRNETDELWRVGRWAYSKGTPIPPFVVAKRGVPIRRGLF
jgi:hypothetical protein